MKPEIVARFNARADWIEELNDEHSMTAHTLLSVLLREYITCVAQGYEDRELTIRLATLAAKRGLR